MLYVYTGVYYTQHGRNARCALRVKFSAMAEETCPQRAADHVICSVAPYALQLRDAVVGRISLFIAVIADMVPPSLAGSNHY